jgi:hypothetical protein
MVTARCNFDTDAGGDLRASSPVSRLHSYSIAQRCSNDISKSATTDQVSCPTKRAPSSVGVREGPSLLPLREDVAEGEGRLRDRADREGNEHELVVVTGDAVGVDGAARAALV